LEQRLKLVGGGGVGGVGATGGSEASEGALARIDAARVDAARVDAARLLFAEGPQGRNVPGIALVAERVRGSKCSKSTCSMLAVPNRQSGEGGSAQEANSSVPTPYNHPYACQGDRMAQAPRISHDQNAQACQEPPQGIKKACHEPPQPHRNSQQAYHEPQQPHNHQAHQKQEPEKQVHQERQGLDCVHVVDQGLHTVHDADSVSSALNLMSQAASLLLLFSGMDGDAQDCISAQHSINTLSCHTESEDSNLPVRLYVPGDPTQDVVH